MQVSTGRPHGLNKVVLAGGSTEVLEDGSSSSKQIANLLQDMGAKVNTEGDEGPSSQQAGMYVGDGLPPVPAKIAAKIGRWEPLPEFWTRKGKKQPSTSSRILMCGFSALLA